MINELINENELLFAVIHCFFLCVHSDPTEMVMDMVWDPMKAITTPKVGEMFRATQERPLATGEIPEVEDDPRSSKEPPWWENKGSHVSITGSPQIRIPFNHTLPKWNRTITRGGILHLGKTAPPTCSIIHPLAVLHKDPQVKGAPHFMATPQVTGHPPQDIFVATQVTGSQVLHHLTRALSGATKGSQVSPIRIKGVETLVGITAPEKGPMSTQAMAWSAGTSLECFLICTMESTGPLGHRGAPERCMGEAHVQRGTGVKQQSQLGKIVKREAWSWLSPHSHRGHNNYLYSAPAHYY